MSEYLYGVLAPAHLAGRPADGNQAVYSALGFGKPEAAFIDVFQRRIAMPKSSMSGIPGADAMADTLEMVKAMWSGMGVPGMMMPSASADDINKQIADLKAVESWLALNMSMLRNTIQALEVQSATISNLHSMRDAMSAMAAKSEAFAGNPFAAGFSSTVDASHKAANGKTQDDKQANGKSEGGEGAQEQADFSFVPPTAEKPPAPHGSEPAVASAGTSAPAPADGSMAAMAAPFANPAAWWNMLQDQFKQAVNTAMTPDTSANPAVKHQAGAKSIKKDATGKEVSGKRAAEKTTASGKAKKAAKPGSRTASRAKPKKATSKKATSKSGRNSAAH